MARQIRVYDVCDRRLRGVHRRRAWVNQYRKAAYVRTEKQITQIVSSLTFTTDVSCSTTEANGERIGIVKCDGIDHRVECV